MKGTHPHVIFYLNPLSKVVIILPPSSRAAPCVGVFHAGNIARDIDIDVIQRVSHLLTSSRDRNNYMHAVVHLPTIKRHPHYDQLALIVISLGIVRTV